MYIYRAHVDSPNFSFEAYADNTQGAIDCLADGLRKHARQRGASNSWLEDAITDIEVTQHKFGPTYRDGSEIK